MKFYVNERCIGCGMCTYACPEVFSMEDSGVAVAIEGVVDASLENSACEAQSGCPVDAIEQL